MSTRDHISGMFEQLFREMAEPYAALAPDSPTFTILAVNEAFERAVRRPSSELEGRGVFDVLTSSPETGDGAELNELRQSLTQVANEGGSAAIGAFRYDVPSRASESDDLFECWWSSRSTAIIDDGEIDCILHRIENVTDLITLDRDRDLGLRDRLDARSPLKETVLIVEPDESWRGYLERLSATKWQAHSTHDPERALEIARKVKPHLMLVSDEACRHTQNDLLSEIQADTQLSSCRVIALISQGDAQRREEVMRSGADDVIFERASAREFLSRMQAQMAAVNYRQMIEERSRQQIYEMFMKAPAYIAMLEGPEHVYTLNNPAHDEIFGHSEIIGRSVREILGDHSDEETLARLDRVYETGEIFAAQECMRILPDPETGGGKEHYLTFVYMPTHDLDGVIDGVAVFGWDVTELVTARQTVEKQAAQLREEGRLKDEFLAMLGHELRNPLAPLASVSQLFKVHEGGLDADRLEWATGIIDRQVRQLTGLVDDLLDVARISEGRIELEVGRFELASIVQAAVDSAEPLVEKSSQTLEVCLPDAAVVLDVDKTRLTQIISNLLHNATKYTPDGGQIRLLASVDGQELLICVEDTGEGIGEEMLPYVFDLFRQSDTSLARTQGGLGLGLTLVRRLVNMHGGSVCALSDGPGCGSRFEVRLPVVCSTENADITPASAQKTT